MAHPRVNPAALKCRRAKNLHGSVAKLYIIFTFSDTKEVKILEILGFLQTGNHDTNMARHQYPVAVEHVEYELFYDVNYHTGRDNFPKCSV